MISETVSSRRMLIYTALVLAAICLVAVIANVWRHAFISHTDVVIVTASWPGSGRGGGAFEGKKRDRFWIKCLRRRKSMIRCDILSFQLSISFV